MKVFLCGPMAGIPEFNAPLFDKVAASLAMEGFVCVNPMDLRRDMGLDPERYQSGSLVKDAPKVWTIEKAQAFARTCLKVDTDALYTCEAICLLPQWDRHYYPVTIRQLANIRGMYTLFAPDIILDAPEPPEEPGDDEIAVALPIDPDRPEAA